MKRKQTFNILNWALGTLLCTLGVAFCTKADFGLSMIAAPPYILHVFLRDFYPWYTQGTSEYCFQALTLIVTCLIIRQFRPKYLLSFVSSVISGLTLDGWLFVLGGNGVYASLGIRILTFVIGSALISLGVAFFFRTTLPIQIPELAVSEIAHRYGFDQSKTKLIYDCIMLAVAVTLTLTLTHGWTGVGIGTILVTFINAPMIAFFCKIIDKLEGGQVNV